MVPCSAATTKFEKKKTDMKKGFVFVLAISFFAVLGLLLVSYYLYNRAVVDSHRHSTRSTASLPRWAVLAFGLPRRFKELAYASLKVKVLDVLPGNVDIFVHTFDMKKFTNPRNKEKDVLLYPQDVYLLKGKIQITDVKEAEQQVENDLEGAKPFGDAWKNNFISLKNLFLQLYSIERAYKLSQSTGKYYTHYLFVRLDQLYLDAFPVNQILSESRNTDAWVPSWGFPPPRGENERFYVTTGNFSWPIANRRLFWRSFVADKKRPVHAEELLKYVLVRTGARISEIRNFCFNRIRGHKVHAELHGKPFKKVLQETLELGRQLTNGS